MRKSADKRAISEARVVPSRLRPRGAQFVVSDDYISTPISQYQAIMESEKIETLMTDVNEYFKAIFSRTKNWSNTYEGEIGAFQERARKLTAHYPNNAELQTLMTSLETKKRKLDEKKTILDQSQPGTGLQSQEFEFLNLDLETKLTSDLKLAQGSEKSKNTPLLQLSETVGNMILSHQHALRLVKADLKKVYETIGEVFHDLDRRQTTADQSISNVTTKVATGSTSYNEDRTALLSRIDSLEKQVQELMELRSSTPLGP